MMDKILFAGYTVQDVMTTVGIGIGVLILLSILKKILRKNKVNPYMQFAVCKNCGWKGQVSRHAGRCPGCNQPLGDRLVSRGNKNEGHMVNH
jgi:predicted Zn-ribbon and HTH transcriptional regulator